MAGARADTGPDLRGVVFNRNCVGEPSSACTIVQGAGKHLLLIGDSHAEMLAPTFAKIAQEHDLALSTATSGVCPWERNVYPPPGHEDDAFLQTCIDFKQDLYERVIPELDPDVIITSSLDYQASASVVRDDSGQPRPSSGPADLRKQITTETRRSLQELEQGGAKVLMIELVPTSFAMDPLECLGTAKVLEDCRFVTAEAPTSGAAYRGVADNRTSYVADFDRLVCPFLPVCDPIINGRIVRFDNGHITPRFAVSLADQVSQLLVEDRLIPG